MNFRFTFRFIFIYTNRCSCDRWNFTMNCSSSIIKLTAWLNNFQLSFYWSAGCKKVLSWHFLNMNSLLISTVYSYLGRSSSSIREDPPVAKEARLGAHIHQPQHRPLPPARHHHAGRERRQLLRVPAQAVDPDWKDHQLVSDTKSSRILAASRMFTDDDAERSYRQTFCEWLTTTLSHRFEKL